MHTTNFSVLQIGEWRQRDIKEFNLRLYKWNMAEPGFEIKQSSYRDCTLNTALYC